jgi:hypothetical protein
MHIAPLLGEKTYYSYVEGGSKIFGGMPSNTLLNRHIHMNFYVKKKIQVGWWVLPTIYLGS